MSESKKENKLPGCLLAIWQLAVVTPIWVSLIYTIINSIESFPVHGWVLFWVYVPCIVLGVVLAGMVRALVRGD